MTARDQLADVIGDAIDNVHDMDVTHRAYAEAAADAVLAMIKPLEWQRNGHHHAGGYGYVVRLMGMRFILTVRNQHPQEFDTIESAKAAANAHHRAQILAALGITIPD